MRRARAAVLIRWTLVLVPLVAAGLAAAYFGREWLKPQVAVTRMVEAPVVHAFYATGTLLPEREYPIKSNNPGYLTERFVDKGDVVKKDQPLAVVREDSVEMRARQAQAELEQSRRLAADDSPVLREFDGRIASTGELLEIARREQQRVSQALEGRAASQSDLDRALDRVKTLAAEIATLKAQRAGRVIDLRKDLQVAQAGAEIAQWNLDRQTVRSPLDHGTVLDRPLPVGTRVAVNDTLMTIADVRPEKLVMRAAVDEEDKTHVRDGQLVQMTLYAFPGRVFQGRVKRIYDMADAQRRTFEIDVEMTDADPALAAGMTAELAFIIESKEKADVIPRQAVQAGGVYVVRDGRVAESDAKIGITSVERAEVLSGLDPNARIIVSPVGGLSAGQRVRTKFIDPAAAAGLNTPKKQELFKGGF